MIFTIYWISCCEVPACITSQSGIWLLKRLGKCTVYCSNLKFGCHLVSLFNENICLTYALGMLNVLGLCIKVAESNPYLFLSSQEKFSERNSIVAFFLNAWLDHLILFGFLSLKMIYLHRKHIVRLNIHPCHEVRFSFLFMVPELLILFSE